MLSIEKTSYYFKKIASEVALNTTPLRNPTVKGKGTIETLFGKLTGKDIGTFITKHGCVLHLDSAVNNITLNHDATISLLIPIEKKDGIPHIRRHLLNMGVPTAYDRNDGKYIVFLLCSTSLGYPVRMQRFPAKQ